uniref:DUF5110 domain-containing protein n=1 Tax=uncultured Clostridium sp. TaxID=59620 RepID=UPI0026180365
TYRVYGSKAKLVHYYDDGESKAYKNDEYNLLSISFDNEVESIKYINKGIKEKGKEFIIMF